MDLRLLLEAPKVGDCDLLDVHCRCFVSVLVSLARQKNMEKLLLKNTKESVLSHVECN
jgi:hypothetical protein